MNSYINQNAAILDIRDLLDSLTHGITAKSLQIEQAFSNIRNNRNGVAIIRDVLGSELLRNISIYDFHTGGLDPTDLHLGLTDQRVHLVQPLAAFFSTFNGDGDINVKYITTRESNPEANKNLLSHLDLDPSQNYRQRGKALLFFNEGIKGTSFLDFNSLKETREFMQLQQAQGISTYGDLHSALQSSEKTARKLIEMSIMNGCVIKSNPGDLSFHTAYHPTAHKDLDLQTGAHQYYPSVHWTDETTGKYLACQLAFP